jgi:hypothetical protein
MHLLQLAREGRHCAGACAKETGKYALQRRCILILIPPDPQIHGNLGSEGWNPNRV